MAPLPLTADGDTAVLDGMCASPFLAVYSHVDICIKGFLVPQSNSPGGEQGVRHPTEERTHLLHGTCSGILGSILCFTASEQVIQILSDIQPFLDA